MDKGTTIINYLGEKIGSGGIESFVANLSTGMREEGINYLVVANVRGTSIYEKKIVNNGGRVIYLSEQRVDYLSKLNKLIKYIKNYPEAIVYFHASNPGLLFYCFLVKLSGNNRIVYHVHSTKSPYMSIAKRLKYELICFLFGRIPRINVACSDKAGHDLFNNRPYQIVHNGIDIDRFRFNAERRIKTRTQYGWETDFVIMQIGRLSPEKNHEFSLKVYTKFLKNHPNSIMVFVGDGGEKQKLEQTTKHNHLDGHVQFIQASTEIEWLYSAADLLLFPSIYEGLGIVAVEAQASGLPIICSQNIVDEVTISSFIEKIPLNDEMRWIEKMNAVARSYIDRESQSEEGMAACKKAGFSINKAHDELVSIYNRLK